MDDEEVLLEMFFQVLEKWDHRVETAVCGQSAIRMLTEKDYDLIVTDCKIPRMGGRELHSWLKKRKPHLAERLLFITGDTVSRETQAFLEETGLPSLAKPFTVAEVGAMIEKLLAARTA